jgi:hypothetical protein
VCDPKPHYGIKDLDVQRGGVLLVKLTEAETSKTTFTLIEKPGTSDERVLATDERKVELLPRNQWGGLSHPRDFVAAFVQPNELAIDSLLKQTAEVLRKAGRNPALVGYQSGAKRGWGLSSALRTAIAGLGLGTTL